MLNPPQVVRWNSEKTYLKELQAAGLSVAEIYWIDQLPDSEGFLQLLKTANADEYFLKPVIGADASGTLRFTADANGLKNGHGTYEKNLKHSAMMLLPFLPSVSDEGE